MALATPLMPQVAIGTDRAGTVPLAPEMPTSVSFERNEGQAVDNVAFVARAGAHRAEIHDDGSLDLGPVTLNAVGAAASAPSGLAPAHTVNYLKGNDASGWHTGIQTYGEVRFDDIYAGTDLVYHGRRGELEYDFVLAPGADPSDIVLSFEGAKSLNVAPNGDLLVDTGAETLTQSAPVAFQGSKDVDVGYELLEGSRFTFDLGSYDSTKKLTIDPVLKLGTLLGGNDQDDVNAIEVGSDGAIYVFGSTYSTNFPIKDELLGAPGAEETPDAFVTKFAPNGKSLIWSTYLGGSSGDFGADLALDGTRAFVTGTTYSNDFPLGTGTAPHQGQFGGIGDAYFAVLSGDGSAIEYGTYYGGSNYDYGLNIARDAKYAYVTGETRSTNLDVPNAYQASHQGGLTDLFLVKFDVQVPGEGPLEYGTYLGGAADDYTEVGGAVFVRNDQVYLTGQTLSNNFPTSGAHDGSYAGEGDAFFSLFDLTKQGNESFVHSTYIGGVGDDNGDGLTVDSGGNVYIVGETDSPDIATTSGAYDKKPARDDDGWLIKLRATTFTKALLTLLGGTLQDELEDVAVDATGIYVVGETESPNFPTTVDRLAKGGTDDQDQGTATKFNKTGSKVLWSTGFGGPQDEIIESAFLRSNDLYVTGGADVVVPTTKGAFQRQPGDSDPDANDVFVLRLGQSKYHARKAVLTLSNHLKAKVKVTVPDGANVCRTSVPVRIQRKVAGKWKTIASATTNSLGETEKNLADKTGEYRALAPLVKKQANAHICKAAKSTVEIHKH